MKRSVTSREELAVHEAGHLVAIATMPEFRPESFVWHQLAGYEIAHVEPIESRKFDWECPAERNELIVKRVVIALAGGAAADLVGAARRPKSFSLESLYNLVGGVDFELAHEWLTLQRYDPHQDSIETEIERLFLEVRYLLALPVHQAAILSAAGQILEHLREADATGVNHLQLSAQRLIDGVMVDRGRNFSLETTLHQNLRWH
jgi:hypothetical protein